jgi:hypothetical protein
VMSFMIFYSVSLEYFGCHHVFIDVYLHKHHMYTYTLNVCMCV